LDKLQNQYEVCAGGTNESLGAILHCLSTLRNTNAGPTHNNWTYTFGPNPNATAVVNDGHPDLQHVFTQLSEQVGKFSTRYANI